MSSEFDSGVLVSTVEEIWETSAIPSMIETLAIPAKSPNFDPDWEANGYLQQIAELACAWAASRGIEGMTAEVVKLEGLTPLVFIDIPAADGVESAETAVFYGHLD